MKLSDRLRNIMARAGFDDASTEWRGDSVFIGRNDNDAVIKAADELDRLTSALPKTADGVTIVPDDVLFCVNRETGVVSPPMRVLNVNNALSIQCKFFDPEYDGWRYSSCHNPEHYYSTKEAAEEAAKT